MARLPVRLSLKATQFEVFAVIDRTLPKALNIARLVCMTFFPNNHSAIYYF